MHSWRGGATLWSGRTRPLAAGSVGDQTIIEDRDGPATISALLGPTNTGKTHRAVARMLEHESGMIGLPLRLLAREVYDRVSTRVGENAVALVTGEEKRVPRRPRYWVCTVEAMPSDLEVDFLAVDEIQLAQHPQRGHVFTARLLHSRGRRETWFLGSDVMQPLVERLLPSARVTRHPRLSTLRHRGSSALRTLPPRSAVVVFSVPQVYELAERLRRLRGGAAVVLGALSPRTRNAQVALYQAGEVDYMVATDAIGMGLNLDIEHVAFGASQKYDGRETRSLSPAELAQIAGRAGRYLTDGSFGTLAPHPPLPEEVWQAVEQHRFRPARHCWWRNPDLVKTTPEALLTSLRAHPRRAELRLASQALDEAALEHLSRREEIRRRLTGPDDVALLWEVCQIPDFGHVLLDHHANLLGEVFRQLTGPKALLEPDWLASQLERLDDTSGDVDTLMMRIELVRTWTYVSHHPHWIRDADHWRERTRGLEDRLSDALHERLVERFVERGRPAAVRARRRSRKAPRSELETDPPQTGPFSQLSAIKLRLSPAPPLVPSPAVLKAHELADAPHDRFRIDPNGVLSADGVPVARLVGGTDALHPQVRVTLLEFGPGATSRLARRLSAWTRDLIGELFAPLRVEPGSRLSAAARGLLYQLERGLGTLSVHTAASEIAHLTPEDHADLSARGIVVGQRLVYLPRLLEPEATLQRIALCRVFLGPTQRIPEVDGEASLPLEPTVDPRTYRAIGYVVVGPRAVRPDVLEQVLVDLQRLGRAGPFECPSELPARLGCSAEQCRAVLLGLGIREDRCGRFVSAERKKRRRRRRSGRPAGRGVRHDLTQGR